MVFCTISHLNSKNQKIHETKAFFTKLYFNYLKILGLYTLLEKFVKIRYLNGKQYNTKLYLKNRK